MVQTGRGPGAGLPSSPSCPSCNACSVGPWASVGHLHSSETETTGARLPLLAGRPHYQALLSGHEVIPAPSLNTQPNGGKVTRETVTQTRTLHKSEQRQVRELRRLSSGAGRLCHGRSLGADAGTVLMRSPPPAPPSTPSACEGSATHPLCLRGPGLATKLSGLPPNAVPARPCRRHPLHPAGGVPPVLGRGPAQTLPADQGRSLRRTWGPGLYGGSRRAAPAASTSCRSPTGSVVVLTGKRVSSAHIC